MNNQDKTNALEWLILCQQWFQELFEPEQPEQYVSRIDLINFPSGQAVKQLLEKMKEAHKESDMNKEWMLAQKLELFMSNNESQEEKARILLEWGFIEACNDDFRDGLLKIRSAHELYIGHYEEHAIILIAIAAIEWMIPDQHNQVISTLSRAAKEFNDFQRRNINKEKARKYEQREKYIKGILDTIIKDERFPSVAEIITEQSEKSTKDRAEQTQKSQQPAYRTNLLKMWNVFENISAGSFADVGVDPTPLPDVYVETVVIEDQRFSVHSLIKGEHVIGYSPSNEFFVIKVVGDSMNKVEPVPLIEGDYVLLRRSSHARNGDIVIVSIYEDFLEKKATIKKYSERNKVITLEPVSSNKEHKPISIGAYKKNEVTILGVAMAVFKLVGDQ